MMPLIQFAVMALATRRVTSLITDDVITDGFRDVVTDRFPPETTKLGYLVTCRKCSSIWSGLAIGLLALANDPFTRTVVQGLALSEITIISDKYIRQELDM